MRWAKALNPGDRPSNKARPLVERLEGRSLLSVSGHGAIHELAKHVKELDPTITVSLTAEQNGKPVRGPFTPREKVDLAVDYKTNADLHKVVVVLEGRVAPVTTKLPQGAAVQVLPNGAIVNFNGQQQVLPNGSILTPKGGNPMTVGDIAPGALNLPNGSSFTVVLPWLAQKKITEPKAAIFQNFGTLSTFKGVGLAAVPGRFEFRAVLYAVANWDPDADTKSPKDEPANQDSDDTRVTVPGDPLEIRVQKK